MVEYKCPVHGVELLPVTQVMWNNVPVMVDPDLNIYECGMGEYYELVGNEFMPISIFDIVKRQKEKNEILESLRVSQQKKYAEDLSEEEAKFEKMTKFLSSSLLPLTRETERHRAFSVDEIVEACVALGINPKEADSSTLRYITGWLYKNKGQFQSGSGLAE